MKYKDFCLDPSCTCNLGHWDSQAAPLRWGDNQREQNLSHVNWHEKLISAFILPRGCADVSLLALRGFTCQFLRLHLYPRGSLSALNLCWHAGFQTFRNSNRSVERNYNMGGLFPFAIDRLCPVCWMCEGCFARCHSVCPVYVVYRGCQALRHGLGLILMQAHGVGLRLRDNCFSEEWMALEYSPSTGASHQAVHHTDLMTGTLWGETKAINAARAQLLHNSTRLT